MSNSGTPTLTEKAPDDIESAYWTFKGSSDVLGVQEARTLLDVSHTARIFSTSDHQWCVTVYLDIEDDTVPDVINQAATEHDLEEVERDHKFDGTLESVTYTRTD